MTGNFSNIIISHALAKYSDETVATVQLSRNVTRERLNTFPIWLLVSHCRRFWTLQLILSGKWLLNVLSSYTTEKQINVSCSSESFLRLRMSTCQTWITDFLSRGDVWKWEHTGMGFSSQGWLIQSFPAHLACKKRARETPFAVCSPLLELCNRLADFTSCFPSLIFHFSFLRGNDTPIILVRCSHRHENYDVKIFANDFPLIKTNKKRNYLSFFFFSILGHSAWICFHLPMCPSSCQ